MTRLTFLFSYRQVRHYDLKEEGWTKKEKQKTKARNKIKEVNKEVKLEQEKKKQKKRRTFDHWVVKEGEPVGRLQ